MAKHAAGRFSADAIAITLVDPRTTLRLAASTSAGVRYMCVLPVVLPLSAIERSYLKELGSNPSVN